MLKPVSEREYYINHFNSYDMLNISIRTLPHYNIIRCAANTSDCSNHWNSTFHRINKFKTQTLFSVAITEFGFCITDRKNSKVDPTDGHIHGDEVSNKMLDITLAFNLSDWTAGYFGEIGGYIAYFSPPGQETELRDIKTRVVLSGGQSTRITLRTMHQLSMPPPLGYVPTALFIKKQFKR